MDVQLCPTRKFLFYLLCWFAFCLWKSVMQKAMQLMHFSFFLVEMSHSTVNGTQNMHVMPHFVHCRTLIINKNQMFV